MTTKILFIFILGKNAYFFMYGSTTLDIDLLRENLFDIAAIPIPCIPKLVSCFLPFVEMGLRFD